MRRPEVLSVKWKASLHRFAYVPLRSWCWLLEAWNYPHPQFFWMDLVICQQGYWLSFLNNTGAKRDALFSHRAFFPYACGCDLGFLQCCNAEQGERWVQLEASWDSADLRPVSRGICLTSQGHGRLSCKGEGRWHTAREWEHEVAGGDGWVCTDRNTQSHCAGHLLTRTLSEVVIGRLSRESEQKELVGYFIQSREDHAEWPQCCLEFTVEGTIIFYLSLKFRVSFSPH